MYLQLKEDVRHLVDLASNATEAFTAALFIIDENDSAALRLFTYHSLSLNVDSDAVIPTGHGLVGWVAKNDKPTHAKEFDRDTTSALRYYLKNEEIKSFAAAPVKEGDRVIGVLAIDSKRQYLFTEKVVKILSEFAAAISLALVRGRRRIKLDQGAVSFDSLYTMIERISSCTTIDSLVKGVRAHLPFLISHDSIVFAVKSFDSNNFHLVKTPGVNEAPLPLTGSRIGMVIQHGTVIYVPERGEFDLFPGAGSKWRSFLGAPMVAHETTFGAIGLLSKERGAFHKADEKALSMVATTCASAFACLYLHNKERVWEYVDPLTGRFNHRYLLDRYATMPETGSVSVVNLIGFSRINQQVGIEGGDYALIETGRRLNDIAERCGAVCRYFGDQFILVFDNINKRDSVALLNEIASSIESTPFQFKGMEMQITPAIGTAFFPSDGTTMEDLIGKALIAANRATITPGQRVALYGGSDSSPELKFANK